MYTTDIMHYTTYSAWQLTYECTGWCFKGNLNGIDGGEREKAMRDEYQADGVSCDGGERDADR
jgi:hypothetical protein